MKIRLRTLSVLLLAAGMLSLAGGAMAQVDANFFAGGAVRIGTGVGAPCAAAGDGGTLRYTVNAAANDASLQFCNGTTPIWSGYANVLYNNLGAFGTSTNFVWDLTNNYMGFGVASVTPTHDISFGGNVDRTIGLEARFTAGAGSSLTINAGGAVLSGSNLAGGDLVFSAGACEGWCTPGTVSQNIHIRTPVAGASGTAYNSRQGRLYVSSEGIKASGTDPTDEVLTIAGPGTRMVWYPRKSSFMAGNVTGTQWNDANIAEYTLAFGQDTMPTTYGTISDAAIAWGTGTKIIGDGYISAAWGSGTTVTGYSSQAFGSGTYSGSLENTGTCTVVGGWQCIGTSVAFGTNTKADGWNTAAWGNATYAQAGFAATAFGSGSRASGFISRAWGTGTIADMQYATVWGLNTRAVSSNRSTAWGDSAKADGFGSVAWGYDTLASGAVYATAFGYKVRTGTGANLTNPALAIGMGNPAGTGVVPTLGGNCLDCGDSSVAVFMGDQSSRVLGDTTAWDHIYNSTWGLYGGKLYIDSRTGAGQTVADANVRGALDVGNSTDAIIFPQGDGRTTPCATCGDANSQPTGYDGMIHYCAYQNVAGGPGSYCDQLGFEVYDVTHYWKHLGASASDRRLKKDIVALDNREMLERLARVETYSFHRKDDDTNRLHYGVIAQQLETVFPGRSLVDTPANPGEMKSVSYDDLVAPLIAAVTALRAQNDALAAEAADLEIRAIQDSSAPGPPQRSYCTTDRQRGRQRVDSTQNRLYICTGATKGWGYMPLMD